MDYTPKNLSFGEEGRQRLINGITKMSQAVKSTLGPSGNTVLIESNAHTSGMTVTKDGVTVARSIDLIDPIENLAVRIMKQAADRTATNAGDGTTTSIVLTEAIIRSVIQQVDELSEGVSMTMVIRELDKIAREVVDELHEASEPVTPETLHSVATISANNDAELGQLIADTYLKVGLDNGVVTVANSETTETYAEVIEGMRLDKGYAHPMFINDHKRDECILDDVHVLVADTEISNFLMISNLLSEVYKQQKKLVIVAPCSKNVLNTLAANVIKNGLKACVIELPSFGYRQHELMSDLAISCGATFFSEKMGDDLSLMTMDDLGHADRVVVSKNDSIVMMREKPDGVNERIAQLREQHDEADKKSDRDFILERIAALSGGIGVIKVGGVTDMEQKERYDRVDDAVCAARSAIAEGYVAGGGVTLAGLAREIDNLRKPETSEEKIAQQAMVEAMLTPMRQIMENAGLPVSYYYKALPLSDQGYGINVKTGQEDHMISMGIIDPTKVTKEAIKNAVSVAGTILSTDAIVTLARSYEERA